jgi:hypothetical protein
MPPFAAPCDDESRQAANNPSDNERKVIHFMKPGIKIGNGKYHPIELIIYNSELYALKRIPKLTIDK